jgi:CDGSH-type Zn-finger protein
MTVCIKARARGPLAVEGPIRLLDVEGNPIDVSDRSIVLLCRCGASKTSPLCDGSHHRVRFEAPPPEPDPEDDAIG